MRQNFIYFDINLYLYIKERNEIHFSVDGSGDILESVEDFDIMDISERKNGYEWVNLDMVDAERAKEEIVNESTTPQVKNESKCKPINFLAIRCHRYRNNVLYNCILSGICGMWYVSYVECFSSQS